MNDRQSTVRPSQQWLRPLIAAFFVAAMTTACSVPETPTDVHDPYEPFNRQVHQANKLADRAVLRPVSRAYGTVLPAQARRSLTNVAENLDTPRSVLNDALQLNSEDAVHNTFRFLINTSLGVFGLFDPATSIGLEDRETGFADTLAVWGAPEGAYLELPLLGPSTERDAIGEVVDIVMNPASAMLSDDAADLATWSSVPPILNDRYTFSDTINDILYESADSYTQLRLFYLENRRFELRGGDGGSADDDFYDDLYDDIDFGE